MGTKPPEARNSHDDIDNEDDLEHGPTTDISADSILHVTSVEEGPAEPRSEEPAVTFATIPGTKSSEDTHDEQPSQLWRWEPALLSIIWEEADTNATARQKRWLLLLFLLLLVLLVAGGTAVGILRS